MPTLKKDISLMVQRYIQEHDDYVLADNSGIATYPSAGRSSIVFLRNESITKPGKFLWFNCERRIRRQRLFKLWKLCEMKVYGEQNLEEAMEVAKELEELFDIEITVTLWSVGNRVESFESDFLD